MLLVSCKLAPVTLTAADLAKETVLKPYVEHFGSWLRAARALVEQNKQATIESDDYRQGRVETLEAVLLCLKEHRL